jgi:hypothetical protein
MACQRRPGPIEGTWIAGRLVRGRRGCHLRRRGESELVTVYHTITWYYRGTDSDRMWMYRSLFRDDMHIHVQGEQARFAYTLF